MERSFINGYAEWQNDPQTTACNRRPHSASFFHFSSPDAARADREGENGWVLSLNGTWKFKLFQSYLKRSDAFAREEFDARQWETVTVPHDWRAYPQAQEDPWRGAEEPLPPYAPSRRNRVGCYLRKFSLPASWKGGRTVVRLEGVGSACFVYLNGERAGYAEGSFRPMEFDLTDLVRPGVNTLAVEVYRWCTGSWMEPQDVSLPGGLFRDVWLYHTPTCFLADLNICAQPDSELLDGLLTVRAKVENPAGGLRLEMSIRDADGEMAAYDSRYVGADGLVQMRATVAGAALWSTEHPYLYEILFTLAGDEGQIASVCLHTGFRRTELRGSAFFLNGRPLLLKGVACGERCAYLAGKAEAEEEIRRIRSVNANSVWAGSCPFPPSWYDLCDKYGLYVMDEANIDTGDTLKGGYPGCQALPGDLPEWQPACLDRVAAMYEQNKNHPCVLIWSPGTLSDGAVRREVLAYLEKNDPLRPVYCAQGQSVAAQPVFGADGLSLGELEGQRGKLAQGAFLLRRMSRADALPDEGGMQYQAIQKKYPSFLGGFLPMEGVRTAGEQRALSAAEHRLRALYQPVEFEVIDAESGRIALTNRFAFTDLGDVSIYWEQEAAGDVLRSGMARVCARPGERAVLDLELNKITNGEWLLNLAAFTQDTQEAPAARAQFVVHPFSPMPAFPQGKHMVETRVAYHSVFVSGPAFAVRFSRESGLLVSLVFQGEEQLCGPLAPYFGEEHAHIRMGTLRVVHQGRDAVTLETGFSPPGHTGECAVLRYTVTAEGILLDYCFSPGKTGDEADTGVCLPLYDTFSRIDCYGRGPWENTAACSQGALLGRYCYLADELPADSGAHAGARWMELTGGKRLLRLQAYPQMTWRLLRNDAKQALRVVLPAAAQDGSMELHVAVFPEMVR